MILEILVISQLFLNPFTVGGVVYNKPVILERSGEVQAPVYEGQPSTVSSVFTDLDNQLKTYQAIQRSA